MLVCGLVALAFGIIFGYDFFNYTLLTQDIINAPTDALQPQALAPHSEWPSYTELQKAEFAHLVWPWIGFEPRQITDNDTKSVVYFLNGGQYDAYMEKNPSESKLYAKETKVYLGAYKNFILEGFQKEMRNEDYVLFYCVIAIVAALGVVGLALVLSCCFCCKGRKNDGYSTKMTSTKTSAYV